jgi:hypothetical protein
VPAAPNCSKSTSVVADSFQPFRIPSCNEWMVLLNPQYTVGVTKFVRHGYKVRERMLVIIDSAIYELDVEDGKAK